MAKKTPPHKNCNSITEAAFKAMIISALRLKSRWWKPIADAKELACVGRSVNKKTGNLAKHYKCATCEKLFISEEVDVDHTEPIINPRIGWVDWDTYIDRMFGPVEAFQVLCKKCHKEKTAQEKQQRSEAKK